MLHFAHCGVTHTAQKGRPWRALYTAHKVADIGPRDRRLTLKVGRLDNSLCAC